MMLSKQFSNKLQADLFGILAMEEEEEVRVENNLVRSPTKVPLPVESVPLPPVRVSMTSGDHNMMPLPTLSPPSKPKFLSISLPNSATSSPRFLLKKWRQDGGQTSPRGADTTTPNFILTVPDLRRSKSCGEGRACAPPSVDFDALLHKEQLHITTTDVKTISADRSPRPPPPPEEFKCGALCLFLPGFGKGKPVRGKKPDPNNSAERVMISRTVSLEKFECGSWASSAIVEESSGGSTANLYFDLPLELIRTSGNETTSPVAAAFIFEKELKGVLKNSGVAGRKSVHESSRHVRFSTSSPMSDPTSPGGSCITPRLRKARDDFNAFLEAQSA